VSDHVRSGPAVGEYLCPTRVHVSVSVGVPERGLDTLADLRVAAVEATWSRVTRRARLTPPLGD
jgi:hypothetical protein